MDKEALRHLLNQVKKTREDELGCDEVYRLMDVFAEAAIRGENPEELMPLIQLHLELCPDCWEEYQALLRILDR